MKINHLTAVEEHLMKLFWKLGSFYLKDVMEQHPEPKPHQNTVSTYLKILTEKEYLSIQKEGRIFRYTVAIPKENYQKFVLDEILHQLFGSDAEAFQQFLISHYVTQSSDVPRKTEKKQKTKFADAVLAVKKTKKSKSKRKKKKKTGN